MKHNALLTIILILAIAATVIAGPVAAQTNATNTTTTPIQENGTEAPPPEEPYTFETLNDNGVSQGDTVAGSVRAIGNPPRGFAGIRYEDPSLVTAITGNDPPMQEVSPNGIIEQDEINVYGTAFGDAAGTYELVIVYWQPGEQNGTQVATNQGVDRKTVSFGVGGDSLYAQYDLSLREHLDDTWKVTMWLERDGERVPGAQWVTNHRTNPESAAINIDSQAEAWGYAARTTGIPGVIGVVVGVVLAIGALRRTGRGPGYGIGGWLFMLSFLSLILASVAYYQIGVILANLPYVMGVSIGLVAFGAVMTRHSPEKRIGFFRRELFDVQTIPGGSPNTVVEPDGGENPAVAEILDSRFIDVGQAEVFEELTESIHVDLPEVPAVRTDNDEYKIPVVGIRPFFARLFADAATLDVGDIATRVQVKEGRLSDLIMVDPKSDQAVVHEPARIVRALPWNTRPDDSTWYQDAFAFLYTMIIILVPPFGLMTVFDRAANIPSVGFAIGVFVTILLAYSAKDGTIDFEAAPEHYQRAEDNLSIFQRVYKETKENESGKEQARRERAITVEEARNDRMSEAKITTEQILDSLGARGPEDSVIDTAQSEDDAGEDESEEDEDAE